MKKVKIERWKLKDKEGNEVEENTLLMLNMLISAKKQNELPKGLEQFRLFSRLNKAFSKADKTGYLELEESDYLFLKKAIEKDIPSVWGLNEDISKAVDNFLNPEGGE